MTSEFTMGPIIGLEITGPNGIVELGAASVLNWSPVIMSKSPAAPSKLRDRAW